MNFLMRSTTGMYGERSPSIPAPAPRVETHQRSASVGSSSETLVSDDPYARYDVKFDYNAVYKHLDVAEDEGWITVPCKELPEKWDCAPDIQSLCSLDRSFLIPGCIFV